MDDDIDIEEHDVMDNPKIRSIFPDLSCVKIEIPDEDELVEEQYGILQPTEEPQEMEYNYDYTFENTSEIPVGVQEANQEEYIEGYIQQEELEVCPKEEMVEYIPQEEIEEDYEGDERSDFYNNEIILGSKRPTPDLELLYEEALTRQPIINLENWGDRLKSSPCFCDSCEILFPTVNALDAHKMISHSYLVAMETPQRNSTARKSTVTSKFCNHCSKTFPDDTSLIKHLYELLPLNNFSKAKEETIEPEKAKPTVLPWPKKIKNTPQVIPKMVPKKIKTEPRAVKVEPDSGKQKFKNTLSRDGKFFAASSLVPKSTLFQCNLCQIGFLSCFSASQHAKLCNKQSAFKKCGICKRKIRARDVKTHELQHNYNDKLKIYTMSKNIYERVLCKCPKCLSCFDEIAFWAHYPKCKKSDKKSIYCPDCDVHIGLSRYTRHRPKHTIKKLTKRDFIIVEFYDQNNVSVGENQEEMIRIQKKERQRLYKQRYRNKLAALNNAQFYDQNNVRIGENREEIIRLQKKERQKLYKERYKNKLALNNLKLTDNDIKVYFCELCGCCQCRLNYKAHSKGTCNRTMKKKYCERCGLCFTTKSIDSHKNLHEKRSFTLKDITVISLSTGKSIEPPSPEFYKCKDCTKNFLYRTSIHIHDCKTEKYITCKICSKKFNLQAYKIHKNFHFVDKLMPELMKKYKLINNMWNVMYMCVSCELVTMTYDAAVTHSQGHLNYIISDLHKQCVVCDLQIAEKEFSLHEKLHTNNETIERESFKILKYNYEDLFKTTWLDLFKELPQEHRQRILVKSIYRHTRSIKMQIEITSPTDETKYFCMHCNSFVDGTLIKQHMKSKCVWNNKLICHICHDVFKSLKQFLSHEGSHENVPKLQTVVSFNNECDREFNNHLSMIESKERKSFKDKHKDVSLSMMREFLLSDSVKATYKLYKCAKCETCLTLKSSVSRHCCIPNRRKYFCEICQQYFCVKKTSLHLEAHRKKPLITKDSFYIVYFNTGKTAKSTAKKELTAKITLKKDAKISPKKVVTAKVSPKKIVTAKVSPKKDVTTKLSPKNVVTPKSPKKVLIAKIYQCQCGLHFTSMKTIEKHLYECVSGLEVSKETCSKCKLVFPTDVLVTHLINHHHKESKIVIEKIAKANLVKCTDCAIYFTNMTNFNSHMESCDPNNSTQCTNCGLKYGKKCFPKHLCSSEKITYINKVTVQRKNLVKEAVMFRCVTCDVTYLQRKSFRYHTTEVNHKLQKPPTTCEICGLKFTSCSYRKHMAVHSSPNEEYKIKVVDPVSGDFKYLTGYNPRKDDNIALRRLKRKCDNTEESPVVEKVSKSDLDTPLSGRRSSRRTIDKASTSRDSRIDFDKTNEIIVPDEVSFHSENINSVIDNDASKMITSDINTLDKNALTSRLKSKIFLKGYGKELYRCSHCKLHYMKGKSLACHATKNSEPHVSEKYPCDICGIEFSKHTLPRHKYVHHDRMKLQREDFVILTESSSKELESSQAELKVEDDSKIDDSSEILFETMNENKSVNVSKVSDTRDTTGDIIVSVRDNCDTENVSVSDGKTSEMNDNVSEINDKVSEVSDKTSVYDKIHYFKCSDCNVCFVDQKMCFEHTFEHEILDSKTYIQCKICDFQFLIDSLKEHMVLHHNSDFRIETLTIHEYTSLGTGLDPKIDVYQAVDKVQSRLVSTTTDVGVV